MTRGRSSSLSLRDSWQPLWATQRSPERATLGPRVEQVSRALKKPFMPHQRMIADVAMEIDPETGLLAYREVILVMMRQNGKSEMILPVIAHRSISWPQQRTVYTTNTFGMARQRWEDVHLARLKDSPFGQMLTARMRLQQEAILFSNGSSYSPISTTNKTGGTGDTTDLGVVDEAWVHDDSGVEGALRPTMLTRPQPQIWIMSMVPGPARRAKEAPDTGNSAWLRKKIAKGRAQVKAGLRRDTAFFELGAQPGMDPGDPKTWWSCMPALGYTIPESAIRADFEAMELADFMPEYLSWWDDEAGGWKVIGEGEWELAGDALSFALDPVALAVDVMPDRSSAAICASGHRPDGFVHVEVTGKGGVADARPGVGWALPRLQEIVAGLHHCVIVVNDPLLADACEAAGIAVYRPTLREVAAWCAGFYDGVAGPDVANRNIKHPDQLEMNVAARAAEKRSAGVGAFAWAQNCVLTAASLAVGGLLTQRIHGQQEQQFFGAWR